MYLEFTEEQQALQRQLRQYFEDLVAAVEGTPSDEPTYTRYIRQMGHDGWLGLGWPEEYGGMARGPIDQMIFVEESHWAGVPLPLLTLNSVGPTIMSLGTEEQKQRLLPGILKGEVHFSIGYTEPSAGTDLASLKTRAVRDGDEYVINGQKIFTSAIQYADYVWLAARTDPDAPKHKGLSVFIVPLDTPGFHWAPLPTIAGDITSSTFYEDVRVPAANLVGAGKPGVEADHEPAEPRTGGDLPGLGAAAEPFGGSPMGAGPPTRRRTRPDGSRMGPDQPGQGARENRRAQAVELEGGVGFGQGIEPR